MGQGNREKCCQECDCWRQGKKRSLSLKPSDSVNLKTPSKNALIINKSSVLKCKQNVMLQICFNKLCLYLISSATTIYNKITILYYLTMNDEINIFHVARSIICFIFRYVDFYRTLNYFLSVIYFQI